MEKSFSKIQDYKEIFDWIFLITNKEIILPLQIKEISIILCELLNQLKPGIIPLISKKEYIYNLHYFIKACKEYGISNQNLISIQDLIENINEEKLINLLKELKKIYEKREKNKTALIKDGKKLIFKTPLKNNPKNNNPNISIQENENYLSLDFFDKNQSNNLDQTTKTKTKTKLNYIIQRNYIAGEATFYVKMFHETSLIPTILKILFDEIWITIIGADPIITKYEPRKQIKIKSRKNKLEEFFIKLHTQKYTFAANTKSEKYIIIRTLRMFLEYPALYPESNQIRGRVIGIEHEIQAVALRCCNLRQASFHINIITNTQNHYPAILRLSQYEFTISSDKNDSLSFQWSDLSINFELKILDKLSIEAIKMTVQNHNQPNETPLFLIFYNIKSTQTRLIFICLKVFSNSVTQALDDQLSNFLVDFQETSKNQRKNLK
ncbi:muscle-specific protein [Anaeramoeba ignava]|uniref:Muscle-specific protein n=1 Tax=Anaeramoeba ignava TaxID=1746090 RepID=A0A9Q0RBU2_ANAIG|nr:muscle-specific protein [Anaeramoeba ignava]